LTMVPQLVQLMGGGKEKDITMSFHLMAKKWSYWGDVFYLFWVLPQMLI
jgi:hypothetical protein